MPHCALSIRIQLEYLSAGAICLERGDTGRARFLYPVSLTGQCQLSSLHFEKYSAVLIFAVPPRAATAINGIEISFPDPGAVPGASTKARLS